MPTLRDAPPVDVLIAEDFPKPAQSARPQGASEGGINAVGAVIAGAIDDAIGIPGAVTRLPVTPQRLREMLRAAGRTRSRG
jgi:CO/xanthine dehydrogenase Mo-binding subunit